MQHNQPSNQPMPNNHGGQPMPNGQPMPPQGYMPQQPARLGNKKGLIIGLSIGGGVLLIAIIVIVFLVLKGDKVSCSKTYSDGETVTYTAYFKDGHYDRETVERIYPDPQEASEECLDAADIYDNTMKYKVTCNGNSVKVEELVGKANPFSEAKVEYIADMQDMGYMCK